MCKNQRSLKPLRKITRAISYNNIYYIFDRLNHMLFVLTPICPVDYSIHVNLMSVLVNLRMSALFLCLRHLNMRGGGGGAGYSITTVRTYVYTYRKSRILVPVHYLLKRLVYWIHILYTGI